MMDIGPRRQGGHLITLAMSGLEALPVVNPGLGLFSRCRSLEPLPLRELMEAGPLRNA
jgi:hypothetical protein